MRTAIKVTVVAAAAAAALYLLPAPARPDAPPQQPSPSAVAAITAAPTPPAAEPRVPAPVAPTPPAPLPPAADLGAPPPPPQPPPGDGPQDAALAAARAFARPPEPIDATLWWERLSPLLAVRARADYTGTDPGAVAYTALTGPPVLVPTDAPRDLLAVVVVPTDAGPWRVELERDAEGWHTTRISAQDPQR